MARPLPLPPRRPIAAIAALGVTSGALALVVNMGMVEIQRQAKAG